MKEMEVIETEHGTFTENTVTGRTAEEVYQEWLESKQIDNCTLTPKTNEQLTIESSQLWEAVEFLLKQVNMIPESEA